MKLNTYQGAETQRIRREKQKTGNFVLILQFSRFSLRHLCASAPLRWGLESSAIALIIVALVQQPCRRTDKLAFFIPLHIPMTSMRPSSVFDNLQPAPVWRHFATLCSIPRPSKGEGHLRDHLRDWAAARGLATNVDAAGNLIVRKPASPGLEAAPGIEVVDEPRGGGYPTPVTHASGKDPVYVGRIREDISHPHGLNLWVVADNIRKGAALNAVQIAEVLVADGLPAKAAHG